MVKKNNMEKQKKTISTKTHSVAHYNFGAPIYTKNTQIVTPFNESFLTKWETLEGGQHFSEMSYIDYDQQLALKWCAEMLEEKNLSGLQKFHENHTLLRSFMEDIPEEVLFDEADMAIIQGAFQFMLVCAIYLLYKNCITNYPSYAASNENIGLLFLNISLILTINFFINPLCKKARIYSEHIKNQKENLEVNLEKIEQSIESCRYSVSLSR